MNQDEWVETMSMLADVTLMTSDFDMDEICDRLQPDFIIYESPGIFAAPVKIAHPLTHPHIPRFGFQMQDPHDGTRVGFLRLMEKMEIKWLFTHIPEAAARQSPELKNLFYCVGLLFDETLFYDRQLPKDIPVSIFGGLLSPRFYNWRTATALKLFDHFSTTVFAHPGYNLPVPRHKFAVMGEDYVKAISRSYYSIADSTRLDYPVRKHLEIPAAGAVLVAPAAASLGPYGFRDMENCILGEGDELMAKMATALDDPSRYEAIRKKGHDLVHARHGRRGWRWFLDFFDCLQTLKPGETIQQQGILGLFTPVRGSAGTPAVAGHLPESDFSLHMKTAWAHLLTEGELDRASAILSTVTSWLGHMCEPYLLMAIAAMLRGNLTDALHWVQIPYQIRLQRDGIDLHDPEELAWMFILGSLTGNNELLTVARTASVSFRHLSLRRIEWLGKILASGGEASMPPTQVQSRLPGDHLSIHWPSELTVQAWLHLIDRILRANGQDGLARFPLQI